MRLSALAAVCVVPLTLLTPASQGAADTPDAVRISGPVVHENLAVFFIHGKSAAGQVPLTLEEALARNLVQVHETGNVNELEIQNLGAEDVFVQSGDIVKGGQQDRTLMVSLVLPPKSGRIPIASFCVEEGRWSARGREDKTKFAASAAAVPSREMKLAMKKPLPVTAAAAPRAYAETSQRQQEVWEGVRKLQSTLTRGIKADVKSAQSASSLQLALESEKLIDAQKGYVNAIEAAGKAQDDIVGYVFAINGKLNSADVYPSNGLFRKMWSKLLNASATEAIGHTDDARGDTPTVEAVTSFLAAADRGASSEKPLNAGVRLVTRDADTAYLFETARADGWVHRNYLAK